MGLSPQATEQRSALDDIRTLKEKLAEALPASEVPAWLGSPNETLNGARPLDVFFSLGLDAVMPAVLVCQKPTDSLWQKAAHAVVA
jgi:hypothetical protein